MVGSGGGGRFEGRLPLEVESVDVFLAEFLQECGDCRDFFEFFWVFRFEGCETMLAGEEKASFFIELLTKL